MEKSTYVMIGIIIILMIAIICVFAFSGNNKKENNIINSTNVTSEEKNINKNEKVNEVISNEIENEISSRPVENKVENTTSSETFEESPKTEGEKAIEIVKKDFGENSNVEISVEGINENGDYRVIVSNNKTTEVLAFYTVNIKSQTFTKKEIN